MKLESSGYATLKQAQLAGIQTVLDYNESICDKMFKSISNNTSNKLWKLLPATNKNNYTLRKNRRYAVPRWKTDRFKNTFIVTSCIKEETV